MTSRSPIERAVQMIRYRPAAPLDRYVESFWWSQRSEPQSYGEHMLPSGRAQLVFALHDGPIAYRSHAASPWAAWSASVVHGPQQRYYIVGPKPAGAVAGVAFRAGCAGFVLGVATSELADQHVALGALWGGQAEQLRQQLAAAADPRLVFRIMEQDLSARVHSHLAMHPAVAYALASFEQPRRIFDIQRQTGYSPRHFIAKFSETVGLTPKQYCRIQRFNRVTRRLAANPSIMLADLAAFLGYSDQAHLTREFREFAGVPPTRYEGQFQSPLHHPAGARDAAPRAREDRAPQAREFEVKNVQDSRTVILRNSKTQ